MGIIKFILLYIWQLPQNLLGLLLAWIYNCKKIKVADPVTKAVRIEKNLIRQIEYKGRKVYIYEQFPGGISCGKYILVDFYRRERHSENELMGLKKSIKHERGHCFQSEWWGPLYLPIPGLWSVINNLIDRIMEILKKKYDYYKCWVEAQADKLGGVVR